MEQKRPIGKTVAVGATTMLLISALAFLVVHNVRLGSALETKYELIERTADGNITPAKASMYRTTKPEDDSNGVVSLVSEDGHRYYHPFNVATEALADNGVEGTAGLYLETMIQNKPSLSDRQKAALKWLVDNKKELPNGAIIWVYPLPLFYSTFTLKPGWPSAFSQGRIIHALIYAARITKNPEYLKLAVSAAKAYATSVDNGGLLGSVDGLPFYEEVPVPDDHSPHILNGHLYSVVALYDLAKESGDASIKALADQGRKSAEKLVGCYDAGYWTKYDLVPRVSNIIFLVRGKDGTVDVKSAAITAPSGEKRPLTLNSVAGNDSIFTANLPGPIFINNFRDLLGYKVQLNYSGDLDGLGIASMRPDVTEYYKLKPDAGGSNGSVTFSLPSEYLSDSSLSRVYQRWHSRLMKRLGEITGNSWYTDVADRWMAYDAKLDADQKANATSAPILLDKLNFPSTGQ